MFRQFRRKLLSENWNLFEKRLQAIAFSIDGIQPWKNHAAH